MQREEKKLQIEIKQLAKKGQIPAAKIMAKDLVRTRNAISKFYQMKAQLQAVSIRIQTMSSTAQMADAMKGAAKAMYRMNKQVNVPAMQRIMMQFEKEGDMMEMKQELMDDTIDGVMAQDGDDEQEEEVINQVLDEIGINLAADLVDAPQKQHSNIPAQPVPQQAAVSGGGGGGSGGMDDDDLTARLNNLRK